MSSRLVLDASAALELVLQGPNAADIADLLGEASFVAVPGLYCGETANALWKYVRAGDIGVEEAVERLGSALALPDHISPDRDVAPEALVAAATHAHPVYDMMYAVLARRFGCRVCTLDHRFAEVLDGMKIARALPRASR